MNEKSITFTGMYEADLERQLWDWRSANPKAIIIRKHPVERLPLETKTVSGFAMLQAQKSVSMGIDYND